MTINKCSEILIDGRNSVYRAVFAVYKDPKFNTSSKEYAVIVFRFLYKYLIKFCPSRINVFWDVPSDQIWRKKLFDGYKNRGHQHHEFDVDGEVTKCEKLCRDMFESMGIYQYERPEMEADDLIYAWCKVNRRNGNYVIVSTDGDLLQIPYLFDNVALYNPLLGGGIIVDTPEIDPVETKCFQGDKSDTIPGYVGIGKVKSAIIASDPCKRQEFLDKNDGDIYRRNRLLMDLTLCPDVLGNCNYVLRIQSERKQFSTHTRKLALAVRGLMSEYHEIISPFRLMAKIDRR